MKRYETTVVFFFFAFWFLLAGSRANAEKPVVIFDQGHGQKFVVELEGDFHFSGLSGLFKHDGFEVETSTERINDKTLARADALVISGAFNPLSSSEIEAIIHFVESGGNLCIMLHVPQPAAELMSRLKIYASNGVVQERKNLIKQEPKEFYTSKLEKHAITKGVKRFAVHGGWALMNESKTGKIIAWSGPRAWIDLNRNNKFDSPPDAQQSFGIAVAGTLGKGHYVVFGDDAIFQNSFLVKENLALGKNLVKWLKSPGKHGMLTDRSPDSRKQTSAENFLDTKKDCRV
ncbi:MAG: DUF4350 domain-containing protein [Nitrospirota bacterium]